MSEAKHTLGPWRLSYINGSKKRPVIVDEKTGARVTYVDDDCRHLALIASAPDMAAEVDRLRAVNADLLAALESYVNGDVTALKVFAGQQHSAKHVARLVAARAAMAKARG